MGQLLEDGFRIGFKGVDLLITKLGLGDVVVALYYNQAWHVQLSGSSRCEDRNLSIFPTNNISEMKVSKDWDSSLEWHLCCVWGMYLMTW